MKTRINITISVLAFVLFLNLASAALNVSLSDHGSDIRNKSSGALLTSGNLRVEIYDASSGGNLIYNETFTDAIANGSWNVMLGENTSNPLSLEFGKTYYKDYIINGENVNFTNLTGSNVDRRFFYAPLGDIASEDINWSTNENLSISYYYATNGSTFTLNYSNFSVIYGYATNASLWTLNYTDYLAIRTYATNASLWTLNYSNFTVTYGYAINSTGGGLTWAEANNGTLLNYSNALNGTLASTIAANTFGNFNQTFNGTTFFLWALLNRTGIGTTSPQNRLNVIGDINATTTVFSQNKNLSLGYDYALNASSSGISWATANNGTLLNYSSALNGTLVQNSSLADYLKTVNWNSTNDTYHTWFGNYTGYNASWSNITNTSYVSWTIAYNGTLAKTDAANTFGAFNQTFNTSNLVIWALLNRTGIQTTSPQNTLNIIGDVNATTSVFSQNKNLSVGYDYATNGSLSDTDTFVANYTNFTAVYGYALNDSRWTLNYTDYLAIRDYALNDSRWTLNYSTYLTKPTWGEVTNGTNVALVTAANSFGAFNQTFNTSNLVIWALLNRTGIQTTSPQNTLNVVGDVNATTSVFSQNKNLSIGYDYSTNGTFRTLSNNTFTSHINLSLNNVSFQSGSINISSNSTCVKIYGATSLIEVC